MLRFLGNVVSGHGHFNASSIMELFCICAVLWLCAVAVVVACGRALVVLSNCVSQQGLL